jgi:hypothetical protein
MSPILRLPALFLLAFTGCTSLNPYTQVIANVVCFALLVDTIFWMNAHERAILTLDWPTVAAFLAAIERRPPLDMARFDIVHKQVCAKYADELTVALSSDDKERIKRSISIDVLAALVREQYRVK